MASADQSSSSTIFIEQIGDKFYTWDSDVVKKLRIDYRIVGRLIGTSLAQANSDRGSTLPLQLLDEEVYCLINEGIARLFRHKSEIQPSKITLKEYEESLEFQRVTQERLINEERVKSQLEYAPQIAIGRKAKELKRKSKSATCSTQLKVRRSDLKNVEVTEQEIEDVRLQILTEDAIKLTNDDVIHRLIIDDSICTDFTEVSLSSIDLRQKLRRLTFQKLWRQGKTLTGGYKFGADFLLYPADLAHAHSTHLVYCCVEEPNLQDLSARLRVAASTKKHLLLARFIDGDNIQLTEMMRMRSEGGSSLVSSE